MPPSALTRTFPLRHPFVWIGCPLVMGVSLAMTDWVVTAIGLALCACLVAVAWPPPEARVTNWEDWMDYPEPSERTIRIPQWDLVTGEVVEPLEIESERKQIGSGA